MTILVRIEYQSDEDKNPSFTSVTQRYTDVVSDEWITLRFQQDLKKVLDRMKGDKA